MISDEIGNFIKRSDKGKNNGVCELDANGKIPSIRYGPDLMDLINNTLSGLVELVEFKGTWDCMINLPVLANGAPATATGNMYIVSVAGTRFGNDFEVGDWIIYDGAVWKRISGQSLTYTKAQIDGQQALNLEVASNLSDLNNVATARENLNVYSKTELDDLKSLPSVQKMCFGFVADLSLSGGVAFSVNQPTNTILGVNSAWAKAVPRLSSTVDNTIYDLSGFLKNITSGTITVSQYLKDNTNQFQTPWINIYRINGINSISLTGVKKIFYNVTPLQIEKTFSVSDFSCLFEFQDTSLLNTQISTIDTQIATLDNQVATNTNDIANHISNASAHLAEYIDTTFDGTFVSASNVQKNIEQLNSALESIDVSNKLDTLTNTDTLISITGTGTSRTLNLAGTIPSTRGGTGLNTFARGDIIQCTTAPNTLGRLAAVATGNALISGGVGAVNTWGKIGLTTHVTGTLPVLNGGHGSNNVNQARINLKHDRNTLRTIQLDLLKFNSTYAINPFWVGGDGSAGQTDFGVGLGFTGSTGTFDNLTVLKCSYPVNMKALFYPEYINATFKTKWMYCCQFNHTGDLSQMMLGMCNDNYLAVANDTINSATKIGEGSLEDWRSTYKWALRFSGTGALRQYNDGVGGTTSGVTRFGFTTNSIAQGNAVMIVTQESATQVGLHWYNITNATTLTYVTHAIFTLPYTDIYRHNAPSTNWHPCISYSSGTTVCTAECERWLNQFTVINQGGVGIWTPSAYHNIFY